MCGSTGSTPHHWQSLLGTKFLITFGQCYLVRLAPIGFHLSYYRFNAILPVKVMYPSSLMRLAVQSNSLSDLLDNQTAYDALDYCSPPKLQFHRTQRQ